MHQLPYTHREGALCDRSPRDERAALVVGLLAIGGAAALAAVAVVVMLATIIGGLS